MNSPGSNFIEPCKQNCIFSLSSWTDAESTVHYREYSPFLSLSHSDAREDHLALDCFVHKVAPMRPGLTLGCLTWTEGMRPI